MKLIPFDNMYLIMISIGASDFTSSITFYLLVSRSKNYKHIENVQPKMQAVCYLGMAVGSLVLVVML